MKHLPFISDFYQNKSIALNSCDYHTPLINSDQSNIEVMYSTIYFAWFAFEHVLKQNPLSENIKNIDFANAHYYKRHINNH